MDNRKNGWTVKGIPGWIPASMGLLFPGLALLFRCPCLHIEALLLSDQVPVYTDRGHENVGFVDIDAVLPRIQVHV